MSRLPTSPPPVAAPVALYSGSVAGVSAPRVTLVTGPEGAVGTPPTSSTNDPLVAHRLVHPPPFGSVATAGVSDTLPTVAPGGMLVPVTDRPTSVMTAAWSAMVDDELLPVTASVRAPGGVPPPPTMRPGMVGSRSMKALSPGPG